MRIAPALAMAAVACVGTACGESTVTVGNLDEVIVLPAIVNRDIDLLFVIDDSPSTGDKQTSLVASFPKMMDALGTLDGGLPNLHIGVVTSDMGTSGSMDQGPGPSIGSIGQGGCAGVGDDGNLQHASPALGSALYISDIANPDGTRSRNYTGELRDVFTQIASVGAGGCGFEQHLASMRRALGNPANGDFVRPNANLAVIILADEDDCSMTHSALLGPESDELGSLASFRCTQFGVTCDDGGPTPADMAALGPKSGCHASTDSAYVEDVAPFADFLSTVKGDPRAVMIAAIVGDSTPVATVLTPPPNGGTAVPALAHSCTFDNGEGMPEVADPAVRIAQLVAGFPGRSTLESVCNDDLTLSLSTIGYAAKKLVGDPCIDATLVDTSPAPGIQPLCEVADEGSSNTIPPCDGSSSGDCWQFVPDATRCPSSPDNLSFHVMRATPPAEQVYTHARCLTAQ